MKRRVLAPLALALLLSPLPGPAQQADDGIQERLDTFVNAHETAPEMRADWVGAADRAFPLEAATEPFSVTYTHRGETYTLDDYLRRGDVLGFMILQGDRVVFEDYRRGTGPEDLYLSYSVSKSIVSTLVGIAVDEEHIRSVDDPVTRYLPFLERSGFRDSTIRDVLHMATNVDFNEAYADGESDIAVLHGARGTGDPPFAEYMLGVESAGPPGMAFNYQSVNTQILGMVVEAATGFRLNRYAERKLWGPMGAEREAYFLTGRDQPGICAYGCFYATLRDYARFGLMSMLGGQLGDTRVVSEAWMRDATTPPPFAEPEATDDGVCQNGYAYQWWIPCGPPGAFRAIGISGQTIFVDPASEVVIAQFSAWPHASVSPERQGEDMALFEAILGELSP